MKLIIANRKEIAHQAWDQSSALRIDPSTHIYVYGHLVSNPVVRFKEIHSAKSQFVFKLLIIKFTQFPCSFVSFCFPFSKSFGNVRWTVCVRALFVCFVHQWGVCRSSTETNKTTVLILSQKERQIERQGTINKLWWYVFPFSLHLL